MFLHLLYLLQNKGNLPNEIIFKIIFYYRGLKHPIVDLLIKYTCDFKYEYLLLHNNYDVNYYYCDYCGYKTSITSYYNKHLLCEKHKYNIIKKYINPKYIIRPFGKLYYYKSINYSLDYMQLNEWKLNRSKNILESYKCFFCNNNLDKDDFINISNLKSYAKKYDIITYTYILKYIENNYSMICNTCLNIYF